MQIDVFTLFPDWFDWFVEQRHVRNSGAAIELVNFREGTPLSGGQVDDTPYGGGAGMVIRVDVMEAAMIARYGEAPPRRRVVALTASGRQFDEALAAELALERQLTLLCGRYEASTSASSSTWPPTRCRSGRTCWPAASWQRWW